jgi:L-amino acid N-acyltransferase YncA/putative methionine-R-sulfoxide reductase with GAF domain
VNMALARSATESDVPAIKEVYAHHVRHGTATFEIEPPDCAEMDRRRLEILSRGLPFLVADVGGVVAGYAYAGRYRVRPGYRFAVEDSVYVHPDFLRRGMGHMLLSGLIESCEGIGIRQMIAVIGDSGNAASIHLHSKLGFRTIGSLEAVGRKFGRWIDTVIMQRAIHCDARLLEIRQIVKQREHHHAALQKVAELIRRSGNYRWAGLYEVDAGAGEVRNLVFSGPGAPAHPVFPIEKGLTGTAIREKRTVNAGDVAADPRYLTAFGTTRSEIIVPILDGTKNAVVGTIDVESDQLNAFAEEEQIFLEDCAQAVRSLW